MDDFGISEPVIMRAISYPHIVNSS
jgi:hypothetical protein